MVTEGPTAADTGAPSSRAVSASGIASFLLGASFFCWSHVEIVRNPFPGSPASHDIRLYAAEALSLAAAGLATWQAPHSRPSRLVLLGAALWLAACLAGIAGAGDRALGVAWTAALFIAVGLLLAGIDRQALTAGMALGVLGSLPIMIFQVAAQTTWPVATLLGWTGGELTSAVRGAAVLGQQRWLRPYGLTPHPNVAGGLAAVACVLLAAAWFRQRRLWQLLMVAAAVSEVLLSFSRSAWISAVLGLAVLATARRGNLRPLALAVGLPALLFTAVFGGLVPQRLEATGSLETSSLSQRMYLVDTAMAFWRRHPMFGIGPAQFDQREVDLYGSSFIPEPVHNAVFLVLAENGIVGLAGASLVTAGIARRIARQRDWEGLAAGLAVLSPLMLDHYLITSAIGLTMVAAVLARDHRTSPFRGGA